jgi:hypothetical protein
MKIAYSYLHNGKQLPAKYQFVYSILRKLILELDKRQLKSQLTVYEVGQIMQHADDNYKINEARIEHYTRKELITLVDFMYSMPII